MNTSCQQGHDKIEQFDGEFHFLSNFHHAYLLYEGVVWPTAEHAYQAMKVHDEDQRLNIAMIAAPGEAKKYARAMNLRTDWDDVKLGIMEEVVRCKFEQNADLRAMLLCTEDIEIIEGNTWNDTFWGVCKGVGENHLGKILMKIREELQ